MIDNEHTAACGGCKDPCAPIDKPAVMISDGGQASRRLSKLTPRGKDVLARIVAGHSSKVIADDLGISPRTVERHRADIMCRTGCRSQFELGALWALATASAEATTKTAHVPIPVPGGSVALRLALATVSVTGGDSLPQIDHLTPEQLRQRAMDDRQDAQAAIQRQSVATAAMLLNDAERCEARALALELDGWPSSRAFQKVGDERRSVA
jgi:DNA-binding CsgD family transcriptional regulator